MGDNRAIKQDIPDELPFQMVNGLAASSGLVQAVEKLDGIAELFFLVHGV